MIRAFASVFLATLFLAEPFAVGVAQNAKAVTADEVARRVRDRDTGRDSRATLRMKLFDRHDRARERVLTLLDAPGTRRAGRPRHCSRWRPPAHQVYLPERHSRHQFPRLGTSAIRRRAFSFPPFAGAGAPHRRQRDAGELRWERLHLRRHRREGVRRLHLRPAGRETRRGLRHPAPHARRGGPISTQDAVSCRSRAWCRWC